VWAAFSSFSLFSSVLMVIDSRTRRLPNAVVLSGYAVSLILLTMACLLGADWAALVRGLAGMSAMYAIYWLIRLVRPDGMGGGDVKLAGLAGLHLGFLGWGALVVGWLAAFVLGTCFVAVLAARGDVTRRSTLAFGPWLLAGAWIGVWFGNGIWSSYTALCGLVFAKG
jgi:leader peptidase (prepilin peptidase) / N-methyltransferase